MTIFQMRRSPDAQPVPRGGQPFRKQRRVWDEWIGDAVRRERIAYCFAAGCLGLAGIALWDAKTEHAKGQFVPYVVRQDALGHVLDAQRVDPKRPLSEAEIRKLLTTWVLDVRSVYADYSAIARAMQSAYSRVDAGSQALAALKGFHQADRPEDQAQRSTTLVYSQTAFPRGGDTWQVDWRERRTGRDNSTLSDKAYRAVITFRLRPPATPADFGENPEGLFITQYSWSEVNEGPRFVDQPRPSPTNPNPLNIGGTP